MKSHRRIASLVVLPLVGLPLVALPLVGLSLCGAVALSGCSKQPSRRQATTTAKKKSKQSKPKTALAARKPTTTLDLPDDLEGVAQHSAVGDGDDSRKIYRLLRRNLALVNACYLHARRREPDLAGKLTLAVTVGPGPQGLVSQARVVSRTFHKPRMESCVIGSLRAFTFPRQAKERLELTVPLLFR